MRDRTLTIERKGYSRSPWRIIDSETGCEVTRQGQFDHPQLGPTRIDEAGFDTKSDAVAWLGVLAAKALP